jgi:alcohol dehydrogenase (NADP+)
LDLAFENFSFIPHFSLLWAKALGGEVWALSHTLNKKEDALKLGANHFIFTGEKYWSKSLVFKFDFILNSSDMTSKFPMDEYLSTLKVQGEFHNVGMPDKRLPEIKAQAFFPNGCKIVGSHNGSRSEMLAMLKLTSEHNIKPMIETIPISEQGCKKAVEKAYKNDVRYRVALMDFDEALGTK